MNKPQIYIRRRLPGDPNKSLKTCEYLESHEIPYDIIKIDNDLWLVLDLPTYVSHGPFFGKITNKLYLYPGTCGPDGRDIIKNYKIIKPYVRRNGDLYLMCKKFHMLIHEKKFYAYDSTNQQLFWTYYFGFSPE